MLRVKRFNREKIILKKAVFRNNIFSKAFGVMFRSSIEGEAHIFPFGKERIISLHMLFVFTPIDVLFLSEEKVVVEIKQNLKPFSIYNPKHKACYVVELPPGTIKKHGLTAGEKLVF